MNNNSKIVSEFNIKQIKSNNVYLIDSMNLFSIIITICITFYMIKRSSISLKK